MTTDPTSHADAAHRSFVREEILRQPAAWLTAAALAAEAAPVLPRSGERVAVIGCGTSWFMAQAYAALREAAGLGETDAFAASQFPAARAYDRVVAISRSGTTTEVVQAIEASRSPVTALTAVEDGPVVDAAQECVALTFADEQSVVQTLFATSVLAMLRASIGADVVPLAEQARAVLADQWPLGEQVRAARQVTFVGQGWAFGIAREAALKMREAAQWWTESYPQMEYRHGPIAIAEPGRAVWFFGEPMDGLVADVGATGAAVVADSLDPQADLIRVQLLAVEHAEALELDPDRPRSLTRSVVLDQS